MSLALGMLVYQDAFLLPKILPLLRPYFDRFIVGYSESTDGSLDILLEHSPIIEKIPKGYEWDVMRNHVITVAEEDSCTHMMFIDSDECMLEKDLRVLGVLDCSDAVLFPRWEFVDDFEHYDPSLYPDFQARLFPLKRGFYYAGKTHEQLCRDGAICSKQQSVIRGRGHLFHYGKSKPTCEVALKYLNYDRLRNGLEPVPELPEDYPLPETWAPGTKERFEGPKPL